MISYILGVTADEVLIHLQNGESIPLDGRSVFVSKCRDGKVLLEFFKLTYDTVSPWGEALMDHYKNDKEMFISLKSPTLDLCGMFEIKTLQFTALKPTKKDGLIPHEDIMVSNLFISEDADVIFRGDKQPDEVIKDAD